MPIEGTGEKSQRQHPWPHLGRGAQGMIHLLPQGDSPLMNVVECVTKRRSTLVEPSELVVEQR